MSLVLFLILFVILTILPFLVSIKELIYPKDDKPLYINMDYYKDPEYFSKSFKKMIDKKVSYTISNLTNLSEIELSKTEIIEMCPYKHFAENNVVDCLLYISTDLISEKGVVFQKEAYVKGTANIGAENIVRSLFCDGITIIGEKTKIIRWVHSEDEITIGDDSNLGSSVSSSKAIIIGRNTRFKSVFGKPVMSIEENIRECFPHDINLKMQKLDGEYGRWLIADKYLSIYAYIHEDKDNKKKRSEIVNKRAKDFIFSKSAIIIPTNTTVTGDFIIKKDLYIGDYCNIIGNIRCYGNLKIGNNVNITGNIFTEGEIRIEKYFSIFGNVFSQNCIFSKHGLAIGNSKHIKSMIGKKKVILNGSFSIFGQIHTEGVGEIN